MALRGKSFSIDSNSVDRVLETYKKEDAKIDKLIRLRTEAAVNIMYATARARRPMITMIGRSKVTGKRKGRVKGSRRVSDPSAPFGVPVQASGGGALRASIFKEVVAKGTKWVGRIWTDNPYAKYLEYGTSKMRARPFIGPALYLNKENVRKIFTEHA